MTIASPRPRASLSGRRRLTVAVVVVFAALGYLLYEGLGNAVVYFRTADEAVRDKARLGARRFRIEGIVQPGTVRQDADGKSVDFDIAANGVTVAVVHSGDPPELFRPDVPVVLEGRWGADHFASDRIMIRHSADYRGRHPERVKDYPR